MNYDHVYTPFATYEALPPDAIVALDTASWMRPMYPNLVKMDPQWIPNGTTRTTRPSLVATEEKQKKVITSSDPSNKAQSLTLPIAIISMDPSKENPTL